MLDIVLLKVGLVRASRYEHLYGCYRDVWRWYEKLVRQGASRGD